MAASEGERTGSRWRRAAADWLTGLPYLGVAVFVALYFVGAAMYPGGTKLDAATRGYSHVSNYWCDLLDAVSYSGAPNPAARVALPATIVLPVSLIPLWLWLPVLFRGARVSGWIVRVAGTVSMICAALVFTPQHNAVIDVAAAFGGVALAATVIALARARRFRLVSLAVAGLLFATVNWTMWHIKGAFLAATPLVEKLAYAMVLLWTIATTRAIRRTRSARAATD